MFLYELYDIQNTFKLNYDLQNLTESKKTMHFILSKC